MVYAELRETAGFRLGAEAMGWEEEMSLEKYLGVFDILT